MVGQIETAFLDGNFTERLFQAGAFLFAELLEDFLFKAAIAVIGKFENNAAGTGSIVTRLAIKAPNFSDQMAMIPER